MSTIIAPSRRAKQPLALQPPLREGAADVYFRKRRVADQVEALITSGGVSDHPIADLVAAVAGVADVMLQRRGEPRRIAVLEQLDAGAVELLVDLAHARLANEMAQAPGRQHR